MKKAILLLLLCVSLLAISACGSDSMEPASVENTTETSGSVDVKGEFNEDEVKLLQEAYINNLHSVKGETIVTRSNKEPIIYNEMIKTEEEGRVELNSYCFFDSQKQYESALEMYMKEESCTVLEQDEQALYIKVKDNDGMPGYFEVFEDSALRGSEFETYVE